MNYSEVEEIFCLTKDGKYKYFFNKVMETEQICGLKDKNGWITAKDNDANIAMPVWPSYTAGGGISVDAKELKVELEEYLSSQG